MKPGDRKDIKSGGSGSSGDRPPRYCLRRTSVAPSMPLPGLVLLEPNLKRYSVGRLADGNELVLDSTLQPKMISRKHATFQYLTPATAAAAAGGSGGSATHTWAITDIGTINGCFVNHIKLESNKPHALSHGDLIVFGGGHSVKAGATFEQPKSEFSYRFEIDSTGKPLSDSDRKLLAAAATTKLAAANSVSLNSSPPLQLSPSVAGGVVAAAAPAAAAAAPAIVRTASMIAAKAENDQAAVRHKRKAEELEKSTAELERQKQELREREKRFALDMEQRAADEQRRVTEEAARLKAKIEAEREAAVTAERLKSEEARKQAEAERLKSEEATKAAEIERAKLEEAEKRIREMEEKLDTHTSKSGKVLAEFECSLCLDFFVNPMLLGCGHAFCAVCLDTYCAKLDLCPLCRASIQSVPTASTTLESAMMHLLSAEQAAERQKRVVIANEKKARVDKDVAKLTRSIAGLKPGQTFMNCGGVWTPAERVTFANGIKNYTRASRLLYASTTGLTQDYLAAQTDITRLRSLADNLGIKWENDLAVVDLRRRLWCYLVLSNVAHHTPPVNEPVAAAAAAAPAPAAPAAGRGGAAASVAFAPLFRGAGGRGGGGGGGGWFGAPSFFAPAARHRL